MMEKKKSSRVSSTPVFISSRAGALGVEIAETPWQWLASSRTEEYQCRLWAVGQRGLRVHDAGSAAPSAKALALLTAATPF